MKLNYRNTLLVGLAFMSIIAFWQLYDNVIPLLLTRTFKLDESVTGVIMAADNVLALFLLPLFGRLSDRTRTKVGKRTPYIFAGTAVTAVLLMLLPLIDNGFYDSSHFDKCFEKIVGIAPSDFSKKSNFLQANPHSEP